MEHLIAIAALHRGGYFFRHDLLDLGMDDRAIRAALHAGLVVRLRHGTYAPASAAALTPEQKHLLVARSVVDKLGPGVALSHHSAALLHTGVSYGADLSVVHVTRLDGRSGRREAGIHFHVGTVVPDDDLVEVGGRLVVVPSRAVVESCAAGGVESGMVTASFALRQELVTRDELLERAARHERWPGMLTVRLSLGGAEPRCESVGEVRSLFMFAHTGVPRPEVQVHVRDGGREIARSDFGWLDGWHVGEFDGLVKYGRLNPDSENPGQVIVEEKKREDNVREVVLGFTRWIWSELDPAVRHRTGARIGAALERSRRIATRNGVVIPLGA